MNSLKNKLFFIITIRFSLYSLVILIINRLLYLFFVLFIYSLLYSADCLYSKIMKFKYHVIYTPDFKENTTIQLSFKKRINSRHKKKSVPFLCHRSFLIWIIHKFICFWQKQLKMQKNKFKLHGYMKTQIKLKF